MVPPSIAPQNVGWEPTDPELGSPGRIPVWTWAVTSPPLSFCYPPSIGQQRRVPWDEFRFQWNCHDCRPPWKCVSFLHTNVISMDRLIIPSTGGVDWIFWVDLLVFSCPLPLSMDWPQMTKVATRAEVTRKCFFFENCLIPIDLRLLGGVGGAGVATLPSGVVSRSSVLSGFFLRMQSNFFQQQKKIFSPGVRKQPGS